MPRLITGLDAARIHANLERVRSTIADAGRDPAEVQLLAAVKYVPLEEIGVLGEAGLTLLGENRAQDLEAKATQHPEFRWHFIGQLQSRKVKQIVAARGADPLRRLGVRAAPARHARRVRRREILLEVNVAGEQGKAGIEPGEIEHYLEASPVTVVGLMTMPPFADRSRGQPPAFRPPARARARARVDGALDGYVAGLRRRCSGRCNDCADRHDSLYVE